MKIAVIGASGTIGREVAAALGAGNQLIAASRSTGDFRVDISDPASIADFFEKTGRLDAIICTAGSARFKTLSELTDEDFLFSLRNKLMGQVNVVRIGQRYVTDNGSITITSGILAQQPMRGSSAVSLVNAGLEGFVRAAQLEMERGVRVNAVSPVWVQETLQALGQDPSTGMPAAKVARAYVAAVAGSQRGQVLDVRNFG